MKKIAIYITMLFVLGNTACSDFLEKEVDLSLSDEQVFGSYENTRGFLANIYTYLPDAFVGYTDIQYRAASRDCMTDNAISYWNIHFYHSVLSDGYSATNHQFANDFWPARYKGIRATNQFMTNARADVIGNAEKAGDDNRLYERYVAEARLIRAILHFDLACWFGDVAIVGDDEEGNPLVFDPSDTGSMNMARTSCADALLWIAQECDVLKNQLPFRYSNEAENWGRVNGATAYALKSRALLYRASALNNPTNNISYWEDAAQAALDFISVNQTQSNSYRLFETGDVDNDYYNCFVTTPYYNDEYILTRSVWNTREIELFLAPCGFSGTVTSSGRTNPTQNLVDSYEMRNGLPIDDENSGYDAQNPYAGRDRRLEQTILHHGATWGVAIQGEERDLDMTYGSGLDYASAGAGTVTGYYTKKFLNNMSFKEPVTYPHACPIFRYAEILLNAAEAINEAYGPANAYQYVNQVRARVGQPQVNNLWTTQDKFRERIRNERRIELCFEDHRFFDERRWKLFEGVTANSERNLPRYKQVYTLYGVTIRPDQSDLYQYGVAELSPNRIFNSPKNYYFPIPDNEVKKAPNLKQNSGWELAATSTEEQSE